MAEVPEPNTGVLNHHTFFILEPPWGEVEWFWLIPFFFLPLTALPAITQQHALEKFIWAMKDTDIQIFLSPPPPLCCSVSLSTLIVLARRKCFEISFRSCSCNQLLWLNIAIKRLGISIGGGEKRGLRGCANAFLRVWELEFVLVILFIFPLTNSIQSLADTATYLFLYVFFFCQFSSLISILSVTAVLQTQRLNLTAILWKLFSKLTDRFVLRTFCRLEAAGANSCCIWE